MKNSENWKGRDNRRDNKVQGFKKRIKLLNKNKSG